MHTPVLMQEVIQGLNVIPHGLYVDCTFGRGGHSQAILNALNQEGRLIAIDKDLTAIAHGESFFSNDPRLRLVHGSFSQIATITKQLGMNGQVNGILMDLGVSSPQLDDPQRGFSFMHQGPLDMRMDVTQSLNAEGFVNHAEEREMAFVFKEYGEERFALRIARAIVRARLEAPIRTTHELAEIVKRANPKWEKHKHPATRVFQAIRIHVNRELDDLTAGLEQCVDVLAPHGRLAVISFHSLEDRLVKQFMRNKERGAQPPPGIPIRAVEVTKIFRRVGKSIRPSEIEIEQNSRARSAVLRIGEKLS